MDTNGTPQNDAASNINDDVDDIILHAPKAARSS